MTFTSSSIFGGGENDSHGQGIVELIAVLDGVYAGFGHGGLQVFNSVNGKSHERGHAGGRAHGDFLVAEFRMAGGLERNFRFSCVRKLLLR